MAKIPEYRREGWRSNGPGNCNCPKCGKVVSTNALGRAAHRRGCAGWQRMLAEIEERRENVGTQLR